MNLTTDRLLLHSIAPVEAQRIIARVPDATDRWHPEYPLEDEMVPLAALAKSGGGDDIFGLYMISTRSDGLAIGGIGFFGPPDEHCAVEVGYGLVEAARGRGFATESLRALTALAAKNGVTSVTADTLVVNPASQNVLLKCGFREIRRTAESIWYRKELP